MSAQGFGTTTREPAARPAARARATRALRFLVATVLAAALAGALCRSPAALAQSAALHVGRGAGLKVEVDMRWPSGGGYRPVLVTVTSAIPTNADRTLTVEITATRLMNYAGDDLRVVEDVEIPAGWRVVRKTISVPQNLGWNSYKVNVLEDGRLIRGLSWSGSGDPYMSWVWDEGLPKLLFVGDKLPDTSGLGAAIDVDQYYQYQPNANPGTGKTPLPTARPVPAADLPTRWIDYTNLDLICLSIGELAGLSNKRPEALRAILEWASAGGTLIVYGVGRDWARLRELESIAGLTPGSDDLTRDPAARRWTRPKEDRFGSRPKGIGWSPNGMYGAAGPVLGGGGSMMPGVQLGMGQAEEDVGEAGEELDGALEPTDCFPFVYRDFRLGLIAAVADDDPFALSARRAKLGWSWLLDAIGSRRLLWFHRHGTSPLRDNPEFWNFLIPGVGLAPVTAFRVLITLFVLAIGPLNYLLLRRWKSLHLLVVTVPVSAAAVTLALFAYAMVADGLGTRVRARSVTQIDQRTGHAACWARLSYYAGLSPHGGLTFPDDVAVIPYEYLPGEDNRMRELIWQGDQWLLSGWLPSRTPTQFLTVRSRRTTLGLKVAPSAGGSGALRVENGLGTHVEQLLVRDRDGRFFWAADVQPGAAVEATPIEVEEAKTRLRKRFDQEVPRYPPGMDQRSQPGYSSWNSARRPWRWTANQANLPPASQRVGMLEITLGHARTATLEPGSYTAVVEKSPEVVFGTKAARQEASFHVIRGRW